MNPTQFLRWGGAVVLFLGLIGFLIPNIGGEYLYFDTAENVAHTILGVVGIVLAPMPLGEGKRWIVVIASIFSLFFGVAGFVVMGNEPPNFFGIANLENPADNVIHLFMAAWGFYAAFNRRARMAI